MHVVLEKILVAVVVSELIIKSRVEYIFELTKGCVECIFESTKGIVYTNFNKVTWISFFGNVRGGGRAHFHTLRDSLCGKTRENVS